MDHWTSVLKKATVETTMNNIKVNRQRRRPERRQIIKLSYKNDLD
jgi:hypothetical protein